MTYSETYSCNPSNCFVSMFPVITQLKPNILILLGDNVYADKMAGFSPLRSPADIKEAYDSLSLNPEWITLWNSIGWNNILTTIDDHDYGENNGDKHFRFKKQSQQYYWEFMRVAENSSIRQQSG